MDGGLAFARLDYAVFGCMLASCVAIGVYFGCAGRRRNTADEYLLGGKDMGVFPISMSLIASFISGITILAVPADVYRYGGTYALGGVTIFLVVITTTYAFVPVFFHLRVSSTFEYIKLRFDEKVRRLCSLLFTVSVVLHMPIVIYVPALALSQGTGLDVHWIAPIVSGVCVLYTAIGGFKAVVWTDTLQCLVMAGSTIAIACLGTYKTGGFIEIMRTAASGQRLDIDTDFDLTKRDTLWTSLLGLYFTWMKIIGIGQGCIQKCLSLPTMRDVRKAMVIFAFGMLAIVVCNVYIGLMIYAKYSQCDPLLAGKITAYDQILPLFAMDVCAHLPGLSGLFIAGVFSAALSTLSTNLNGMSCTIYQDFLADRVAVNAPQTTISAILKGLVVAVGIVATVLVFAVGRMGGALELGFSLGGVTLGPILGMFLLGMLVPSANSKGALAGAVVSLASMVCLVGGSKYYKMNGHFRYETKPVSIQHCPNPLNYTTRDYPGIGGVSGEPLFIFRVSHYYYGVIGTVLAVAVGVLVSRCGNAESRAVGKDLISPLMHWSLPKRKASTVYLSVDKARKVLAVNDAA